MTSPFDTLKDTLRTALPDGGTLHARFATDGPEDYPDYLYVEDIDTNRDADEDLDGLPEDILGEETAEKVDSLLNECREQGLLPGYTAGQKFYELTF